MKLAPDDASPMPLTRVFGMRPNRLKFISSAARVAELGKPCMLLEVGCGNGISALSLSQEYSCNVIGIDSSDRVTASAAERAEAAKLAHKVEFLVADAVQLPFPNSTFDTILCEAVFSTLVDKERAAKEFCRVLTSGGKLLMLDFILRRQIPKELQNQVSFIPCLARTKRIEEYVRLFQQAGFQNPHTKDYSQEVKGVGYWIAYNYGSWDKLFANLPTESCCFSKDMRDISSPAKICQRFSKEARLGYALIALTKP